MRLLRLSEVESSPNDRIYRYSRSRAVFFVVLAHAGAGWLAWDAYSTDWKPGYFIAAVILLFINFLRRFITARFRDSNWLVRTNDTGVYIQFRSYLNYHLPANDLTVVFLSFGEIGSARLVKERVTIPNSENTSGSTQYLRYIELEIEGDVSKLSATLDAELCERAPKEKRWYGDTSVLYQDHPVRMTSPPFLQIRWGVVPGARNFLNALRPYTVISEPVSLARDFSRLQALSREEQQKQLRELVGRGESIAAIYTARRLYGCGLAEAKGIVEGLQSKGAPGS